MQCELSSKNGLVCIYHGLFIRAFSSASDRGVKSMVECSNVAALLGSEVALLVPEAELEVSSYSSSSLAGGSSLLTSVRLLSFGGLYAGSAIVFEKTVRG